jgi:hypothetical protein
MERRMKIADIVPRGRHRKYMGNLQGLAHSIKTLGLLQAVGVSKSDNRLIFGHRRLEAVKLNGDTEIDCRILDIENILEAESAENEVREMLQPSEKLALAREIKAWNDQKKEAAGIKAARGAPPGNRNAAKGRKQSGDRDPTLNSGRRKKDEKRRTEEQIAHKAGFGSRKEMKFAEKVEQEGIPELAQAMDEGRVGIKTAARLAEHPKEKQAKILKEATDGKSGKVDPRKVPGVLVNHTSILIDEMESLIKSLHGIRNQFGTASAMFGSPMFALATVDQNHCYAHLVIQASEMLAELAGQMETYLRETADERNGKRRQ